MAGRPYTLAALARKLDDLSKLAILNAETSGTDDEDKTWRAHADAVKRIAKAIREPPPKFVVAELQPDQDSPGLWIGFERAADRKRALQWFTIRSRSEKLGGGS